MTNSASKATPTSASALSVRASAAHRPVSPLLFGLFYEDINLSSDGGLNANLVNNHSFEGVYLDPKHKELRALAMRTPTTKHLDRARHWETSGPAAKLSVLGTDAVASHGHYGRLTGGSGATLTNHGYPGDAGPSVAVRAGVNLRFTALARGPQGGSRCHVVLLAGDGNLVAEADFTVPAGDQWTQVVAELSPTRTVRASLQLVLPDGGTLDLDEVRLIPEDHWGAGDPRWSQGLFRRDLVEALRDLAPRFMRFPGGCIVEGLTLENAYDWKASVGPLAERRPNYNLWGMHRPDGDYSQSLQIGFYEYFLLCEDLGMEPMPVVSAGLACQFRSREVTPVDGADFSKVVQDTLDLIDWATGDPATNAWAAKRAAGGHPEPFRLNLLGIGNENHGPVYLERFERIRAAVDAHHPGLTIIMSSGTAPAGKAFDQSWAHARTCGDAKTVVDEHFYKSPAWFIDQVNRYDDYPRGGAQVFMGEYAAHVPTLPIPRRLRLPANTIKSAIAEAAFLTGVERNADVVAMTSYAPLLNHLESELWQHNLIDFDGFTVTPTANAAVQKLFATTLGERIVDLDGELPAGVFASASRSDDRLCVHLVNTTTIPQDVTLTVDLPLHGAGSATVLAAPHGIQPSRRMGSRERAKLLEDHLALAVHDGAVSLTLRPQSVSALEFGLASVS
ncbi:MAG TPA: alpha-L-arabinofuranosidase C-terminal domain-containing protein [Dermatophilaceae bacterium]|uniref:non-reducing end alpha-L-arabinofuranosidase n=1 Tax=Candidatus Phosphoribacter hodrii TaxID=2953743 RepID=A0A9D7XVV9_9MICO|nr:alpha-L-arabinofuranosidase [Candidatus Phosphoribacter hodrii]HOA03549.1 alpha-L-arabinofuranosidase C-terminal domain-containing protein [Dermatophilaceae bacterium]HOA57210.1 alpha-L-arabinofuranosidase C-terminal domain-containing protein [Dermatophilaceae bacterium]HPZ68378.1 alpha-L-arabinofuranosidase C-terminal domain-containing protein [Dermatophilaceae bacterium]HQD00797.1 alpha-L-arabinofuranosidase C-terminal domain-containing protein [Dermatophilaceae bacterium]